LILWLRFLEEEAEQLRRVVEESAAEAKLKREQQIKRENAVSIYLSQVKASNLKN
jgi:hypothetical protein